MRGQRSAFVLLTMLTAFVTACSSADVPAAPPTNSTPQARVAPTAPPERELFVSPSGDDDSDGSRGRPFKTIPKAASAATPGTTVHVADGDYPGSFTTSKSGTATARVVYMADHTWRARVVGDGNKGAAWDSEGQYVDVAGFDISGDEEDGLRQGGSFGRMVNNRVHGFKKGNCISTFSSDYQLHDIDVIGNVVFGCGEGKLDHGIYMGNPRGTVADNMSYGNAGDGIECWHNCNQLAISNNLVFANRGSGIVIGQGDDPNDGDVAADNFVVSNNIVYDNGKAGIIENGTTGPNNRYLNNLVFRSGNRPFALQTGQETGTITVDPGFVNYRPDGSGDYHLQPTSPAVDTGTSQGAYPFAFDGTQRPQGGGYDIGIYER